MSVSVTLNGLTYSLPSTDETSWGTNVTGFMQSLATGTLQKSGGTFALTADANFGGTYGLVSSYFTSRTASAATSGAFRLARADGVLWRNQADGANLTLGVDSSNNLEWEGVDVTTATNTQTLTNKTLTTPTITDTGWLTPTLVNSWVDFGSTFAVVGYRKLANGDVELRGAVKTGSSGTATITTLPEGYRPTATINRIISSAGRIVILRVSSAGVVAAIDTTTEAAQTSEVVVDGVVFPTV
jgi:hypothetical protein